MSDKQILDCVQWIWLQQKQQFTINEFGGLHMCILFNPLTCIASFLALRFTKTHKQKNWLYNACLDKTFLSSRNASLLKIQLPLFYSPLNSCSDGFNHRSLQGKSPSSAGFKSFTFISLPCFSLPLSANQAIVWPLFLLQTYTYCHLVPHVILHQMVLFLLRSKKDGCQTD